MKVIVTVEVDVPEGTTPQQIEEAVKNVLAHPLEIGSSMIYGWASTSAKVENA